MCKYRTQKSRQKSPSGHRCTTLSGYIFATKAHIDNRKIIIKQQCFPYMPYNMANFDPLVAEICWRVWGTPANFNRFRVLASLLHGTPVLDVSQTLRRWTESATYIRQGGHHVGHWPAFLVSDKPRWPSLYRIVCLFALPRLCGFLLSNYVFESGSRKNSQCV